MTSSELRFYPPFRPRKEKQKAAMNKSPREKVRHDYLVDANGQRDESVKVLCPFVPYENWVKSCGTVAPILVKTTGHWRFNDDEPEPVDPDFQNSMDRSSYMEDVRRRKRRAGWLRVPMTPSGKILFPLSYVNVRGVEVKVSNPDELAAEITRRRKEHEERTAGINNALRPMEQKLAEIIAGSNKETLAEVLRTVGAAARQPRKEG